MRKILSLLAVVSMVLSGLIVSQLFISMPVIAPGTDLPDLAISPQNITINPATPRVGEQITVNAAVWNVGNADVTNVSVSFYEEDSLIGTTSIYHLPVSKYWASKTVDSTSSVGSFSSMAVNNGGGIHISYYDYTNGDLKYAYKSMGGSWTAQTIDSAGDVGRYCSLAIDDANGVHIGYYNNTNGDLKYAYKPSGGSWTTQTIDSAGDVGRYCSLAIDDANGIHISYLCEPIWWDKDLKYAYRPSGGSWTNYTVDSTDCVGEYSSIDVDSYGGVHISYYDYNNSDLKYAYKPSGGSWTNYTVDSSGQVGTETSIAVDNFGGIHISYHNEENDLLKYAYKLSGEDWTNYTVDSSGNVGTDTSIAVDSTGGIHISYFDDQNDDLKYAYKPSGENWTTHIVDSTGKVGSRSSIAVDDANGVHISYSDITNEDLRYAKQIIPPGKVEVSLSFITGTPGLTNITVKIDENNGIEELDETNNDATLSIIIEKGPLAIIEVAPQSVILELNETQQFTATGYDYYGNEVSISPTWDINGGGTINQSGLCSANYPGTWTVYANQSGISGIATATVLVNGTSDLDSDGMLDWWEIEYGLNPFDGSDSSIDPDLDYLTNLQEFLNYSNPNNNETDGDSLGDGFEVVFSKTNASLWDTNGNGIGDGLEFIQNKGYLGWIGSLPDDWIGMAISWENYTMYVKTNSSVLEGEFDKDEKELKIKVSGQEGTQGVTELDVPKGLCDPDDIEIQLDGELINYTLTEDDDYYYIHTEYNHSVHVLSANFNQITETSDQPANGDEEGLWENMPLFALIIAITVIILLLIPIIRINNGKNNIGVQELPPEKLVILLEEKHKNGEMTDETYEDIKSLLEKYNGG